MSHPLSLATVSIVISTEKDQLSEREFLAHTEWQKEGKENQAPFGRIERNVLMDNCNADLNYKEGTFFVELFKKCCMCEYFCE